jgi:hypothetical protein
VKVFGVHKITVLLIPDGEGGGMTFCNGFLKKREKLKKMESSRNSEQKYS